MTGQTVEDTAIADWFNSRLIINPAYISQDENRLFEVLTVLELMQALEPGLKGLIVKKNGEIRPDISFSEGKLCFNRIPIDKLSTGFVSIIKIFQEIIAGYGGWGGLHGETDLKNMDGVVFIDEIESHLHPKWQYRFIPLLKKFFPNTTFYIATHSPTIVSTTDEGEAYELIRKGNDVTAKRLGNPREWYLVDVFSQGFHVDFDEMEETESEAPSLADMLRNFSEMVKDYTIRKDDGLKQKIEALYQKILPSLPKDDPRRRSLDSLKGLVR
ncbi:ATP-binding protein [Desulfonema ishimotonii]|uniref:ATP-binding protein n=2 Tax=Desulfonema ishimotonii TaxID=45657 RepID=A0A401G415_9BACT|nr:ATP-binding protein [Desulfonema ishimotonii]